MKNGVMLRKLILLAAILLSIIVGTIVTYAATSSKNKVNENNVFLEEEMPEDTYNKVGNDVFFNLFESFEIIDTSYIKPYYDDNNEVVSSESKLVLNCDSKLRDGVILENNQFVIKFKLGASWINYRSKVSSSYTVTAGKTMSDMKLSGLDQIFPTKGPLWFTKVKNPTLYVMITWTQKIGSENNSYYTILQYEYNGSHFVLK